MNAIKHNGRCILLLMVLALCASPAPGADGTEITIKLSSENIFQGDAMLVKVFPAKEIQSVHGTWEKLDVDFHHEKEKDFFFSFLPIDMEKSPGEQSLAITTKTKSGTESIRKILFHVMEKSFPTEHLTLPESKVTLSKEDLQRHNREKAELEKIFKNASRQKLWKEPFIKPCKGKLGTPFGVKRILNNKPRSPHSGVDLKADYGTPVSSSSDGIVAFTGDFFFSGNSVFIDHGMGIFTMYFHLSSVSLKQGDAVSKGQVIGFAGSTGRSTGPHLHWSLRIDDQRIDPLSFISLFDTM